MARYHVSPRTGNPGACKAKISCPYGSFDKDHFDSAEEARAAYEAGNLDSAFSTLTKAVDETLDSSLVTDDELLAGIARAGWPVFDPEKGDAQFDGLETQPLTDETMAEMDSYYKEFPIISTSPNSDGTLTLMANGVSLAPVANEEEAEAVRRIVGGSGWRLFSTIDVPRKYEKLASYLSQSDEQLIGESIKLHGEVASAYQESPESWAANHEKATAEVYLINLARGVLSFERDKPTSDFPSGDEPPF